MEKRTKKKNIYYILKIRFFDFCVRVAFYSCSSVLVVSVVRFLYFILKVCFLSYLFDQAIFLFCVLLPHPIGGLHNSHSLLVLVRLNFIFFFAFSSISGRLSSAFRKRSRENVERHGK